MTNEQVKDILHRAVLVYIDSLSDSEYFTAEQLKVLTASKIIGKALKKQDIIKGKIEWLKGFSPSDTISIVEVLNAFEDCEVEEC